VAALALLTVAPAAPAQSTWNNPAGGNWSAGTNWVGGTAPASGTSTALVFGAAATQTATYTVTNDLANPFTLNALTFNNTSGTVTLVGGGLSFDGTAPTLNVAGAGNAAVNPSVTLAVTATVAGTGTGALTLGGAVTGGANDLVKSSAGGLTLAAGGTLNRLQLQGGATTASGGTLALTFVDPSDPTAGAGLLLGTATGQTASFTASGGAKVNVTENVIIGNFPGSSGTVTVTGAGTALNNTIGGASGLITVANNGPGTLTVSGGGAVTSRRLDVGVNAGGTGTLNVQGGGTVRVTGSSYWGQFGGSTATVTVTGAGSSLSFTGPSGSPATLVLTGNPVAAGIVPGVTNVTVSAGGSLAADILNAGQSNGSAGTMVTVTDAGSTLTAGLARVGGSGGPTAGGPTTLNIVAGGAMTVTGNLSVYGQGTVNVNAGTLRVAGLANGLATSIGNISLTGSTLTINTVSSQPPPTYSGVIGGDGGLAVTGTGGQILAGANTYGGGTTVSGGRLLVTNASGTGTGTGPVMVSGTGVLGGTGTITGAVTVGGGGAVSPGTSVGTLNVGSMTWQGGGRYDFEFTSTAGDLVNGTGALGLGSLNSGNRFTINIASTNATLTTPQTYTIATFAGGVSGFDASAGNPQFAFSGFFVPGSVSVAVQGNNLRLTFTPVPEPAHLLLACAAATGLARWLRRRR
jgi:T5SS/PEP-CTERM-associated repeat protein/autotransporter-associated beta strand protein